MLSEQKHFGLGQAEGQDSLRQPFMRDYNNKSNGKQVKENSSNVESAMAFSCNRDIYTYIYTDSLCCTAENNTTL